MIEKGFVCLYVFSSLSSRKFLHKREIYKRDVHTHTYDEVGGDGWPALKGRWGGKQERVGEIWGVDMVGSRWERWPIGVIGRRGLNGR
jgi:hypothetical protein